MPESLPRRLPRGRHALPPDEVARVQRGRLSLAMAEVMAEKGYAATSVEDVLKRAKVSRQSFYTLFDSKISCFMATFEFAGDMLIEHVLGALTESVPAERSTPLERYEHAVEVYLKALEAEWPFTRLFLVEVYAAGPQAISRRRELQQVMAAAIADMLGVTTESGRLTCSMIVAATSALVTAPVAENDREALRAVGPALVDHARDLINGGLLD
ncbi:TetR/AcrR family transcriptional regulator [Actinocorallia longicatena]|uniref:HTH tetR-type domain-containing protein n=1 Tax=Actinocorallia longicatena TaxID=111803 RepID=A0ABP6Q274_9ACTN